ncbi:hypothetical protein IZY60_14385 [Lutibacter sp. B2]|nr:hypothetical protein [Lutibacter sp. B2]
MKSINVKNIEIKKVFIDKQEILKFLGYRNRKVPSVIQNKINEEYEEVLNYIRPSAYFKKIQITSILNGKIELENNTTLSGKHIFDSLRNCSHVYICIYSIGDEIRKKISEYSCENEMLRAMILDKMAVVALDFMNESIKKHILENEKPLYISSEIYPGDKDFEVSNQKVMYDLLKLSDGAIRINKNFQLYPLKSVSVIFGIGKNKCTSSRCENCKNKCYEK